MNVKKSRLYLIRILLAVLILANMTVIFLFSAQNGDESDKTSGKVTQAVAQVVVKDFEELPPPEQEVILNELHPPLRKIAHMAEFGSLGMLILLLLLTWQGGLLLRYIGSLTAVFLYACTDELHQSFTDGRGPQFTDVLIDLSGAVICCTVVILFAIWWKRRKRKEPKRMRLTNYTVPAPSSDVDLHIAVTSDLHDTRNEPILELLRREQPDLILIPGDLTDDRGLKNPDSAAYAYLRDCAKIAPTFYSFGNHELGCYHKGKHWTHPTQRQLSKKILQQIRSTGAVLLDDEYVCHGELSICGLRSGLDGKRNSPNEKALKQFADLPGIRILLCHHPEYYLPYIKSTGIELTVCGHAHGGQWRIFGRGVYAPGQGIFPKYTAGMPEPGWIISRGLGNHTHIPRIFNPPEVVMIHYTGKNHQSNQ